MRRFILFDGGDLPTSDIFRFIQLGRFDRTAGSDIRLPISEFTCLKKRRCTWGAGSIIKTTRFARNTCIPGFLSWDIRYTHAWEILSMANGIYHGNMSIATQMYWKTAGWWRPGRNRYHYFYRSRFRRLKGGAIALYTYLLRMFMRLGVSSSVHNRADILLLVYNHWSASMLTSCPRSSPILTCLFCELPGTQHKVLPFIHGAEYICSKLYWPISLSTVFGCGSYNFLVSYCSYIRRLISFFRFSSYSFFVRCFALFFSTSIVFCNESCLVRCLSYVSWPLRLVLYLHIYDPSVA